MQIFLSNPRGWSVKELGSAEIAAFRKKGADFGMANVFAHMTYLPNIASPNEAAYRLSVGALRTALVRCNTLGVRRLILHLGSHLGQGKEIGFGRAVKAIASVKEEIGGVTLLLENEAGQNNSIGSTLADLTHLRVRMGEEAGVEVGFCLDTCHAFEAGYDLRDAGIISDAFEELGVENVGVIHLNDAKYDLGKASDRHANIGYGFIGKEGFRTFLNHKAVRGKALIMETPMRGPSRDGKELELVRSLAGNR
jgi:deoxyribonuclease-4